MTMTRVHEAILQTDYSRMIRRAKNSIDEMEIVTIDQDVGHSILHTDFLSSPAIYISSMKKTR